MTPDAGTSGEVATNRGMVFIPEIGDHVMLGFRYNDPNRPFVMGSLFNGTIGAGGSSNNNIKSIYTRTGSTITFDEGASSILVKDPSGNTWFMDGAGNISVTAPNDITITAGKNMSVNVGENLSIIAGENISETAGQNKNLTIGALYNVLVGNNYFINVIGSLFELIKGNRESETSERKEIAKSAQFSATEKDIVVNSTKTVLKNSGETSNAH